LNAIVPLQSSYAGKYRLQTINPENGLVTKDTGWFDNLITNAGLDYLGNSTGIAYLGVCRVGTGNSVPANANVALDAQIAAVFVPQTPGLAYQGGPNYGVTATYYYDFPVGAAAGNLSEVGIAPGGGSDLFSRALIVDGFGAPTTITVLITEILRVSYQITVYPPLIDNVFNVTISGVVYTCTARACGVTTNWEPRDTFATLSQPNTQLGTGGLVPIYNNPYPDLGGQTSGTLSAYTPGNYYIDGQSFFGVGVGNGVIQLIEVGFNNNTFQILISPTMTKTNLQTLTLNFRRSWARHAP